MTKLNPNPFHYEVCYKGSTVHKKYSALPELSFITECKLRPPDQSA